MKKLSLVIFASLVGMMVFAQQNLKDVRRKSWVTLAYPISADSAETYIRKGIRTIDQFLKYEPTRSFLYDSVNTDELPTGNYLLISVKDTEIVAEYVNITSIIPVILNNQVRPKILIRDKTGAIYKNATVWVDRKKTIYNDKTFTYEVKQKNPDQKLIRIEVPGDTSFISFSTSYRNYRTPRQQIMSRIQSTKAGRIITWLPLKIKYLATNPPERWFRKRYHPKRRSSGGGYMVFNKPKYFPSDTIKFKAYILNAKNKQYKKEARVFLSYSKNNAFIEKEITTLKPVTPGAFVYEFATGDTLPNDTHFNITFKNKKKKQLLNGNFRIEDYLLDEVTSYNLQSNQEKYFAGDTLQFSANAKDANGLGLMDGRVKLVLIAQTINQFHNEQVFVPDTLWQNEKVLAIDNDTKFEIPTDSFPHADITIKAVAIFRNSNNEIQTREKTFNYISKETSISVKEENGLLKAEYTVNGKSKIQKGWMENDLSLKPEPIQFPFSIKLDPQVETYDFYITNEKLEKIESNSHNIEKSYQVIFSNMQEKDSLTFILSNPNKTTVFYSLFDKDKKIAESSSSDEYITWKGTIPENKVYFLRWHYYWAGEEKFGSENIALYSKLLTTTIKSAETIYPGQTDTITIKVNDYKNKAANNVNLTAVSYNTQFGSDMYVPSPPYIQKFKGKSPLLYNRFETEEAEASGKFVLGKHQSWRKIFQLDTMPYYQFLFPEKNYHIVKTQIQDVLPQLSVFAVSNGSPQEIFLLYINRHLVYYNGSTAKSAYAFTEFPGYTQIGIRLKDKYIEYDSIYLQHYYKHDIVFDINQPDSNKKIKPAEKYWSSNEKTLLNEQLLRIENNYRNNYGYVWQTNKSFYLNDNTLHIAGPFSNFDSIQFYKPNDFDFKFVFEPGYQYRISPNVVRLEKTLLVPYDKKVYLNNKRTAWILGDTIGLLPEINYSKKTVHPFLEFSTNEDYTFSLSRNTIKIELPKDSIIAYTVLQSKTDKDYYRILWGPVSEINHLPSGNYSVVLVTNRFKFLYFPEILIDKRGTYCIKYKHPIYDSSNAIITALLHLQEAKRQKEQEARTKKIEEENRRNQLLKHPEMVMPEGTGMIQGKVIDSKGNSPIPSTSITLKGYKKVTISDKDGNFELYNLMPGEYTLVFAIIGYTTQEIKVTVYEKNSSTVNAFLKAMDFSLSEVVVIGYGTVKRKALTGSIATIKSENLSFALQGKVAGLSISSSGAAESIRIRGANTLSGNIGPLYIVDGVPYDVMPDISPDDITSTSVLKDKAAIALYGSRAANGAVVITTKAFNPKAIRDQFRDYAFWKPNLITNQHGEAKFAVTYPDNITSWQTFVVGIDKKGQITKTSKITKSFKPFLAQLNTPQFLIEGDSVNVIGKKINYTTSDVPLTVEFSESGITQIKKEEIVKANTAAIDEISLIAPSTPDSLRMQFSVKAANGFADGEIRKIPVLKKGTTESTGVFYIMNNDTTINYNANENAGEIKLYFQNNTIDLLLEEIEQLKKYPYYCMEQTASKLTGLAMEKKIRGALGQPFKNEKEMQKLKEKLQKSQLFDGGWSWWENGKANIAITNYVIRDMLELKPDASLEPMIRNALLFIQNQLPKLDRFNLLECLYTLSEAGHDLDYAMYLQTIPFDSVSQHSQWRIISIMQKQKMNYSSKLQQQITATAE